MAGTHLDKVLRHAQKKLAGQSFNNPKDLLEVYRRFLKVEEHRLKLDHNAGADGLEVAQRRTALITVVLQHLWEAARENTLRAHLSISPRMSLVAVGGFGRGELNPFSDVDILFIHAARNKPETSAVGDIVEQVLYMLWDVGFKVGHATRTLEDVYAQANEDLQTKTALLEARFIDGDKLLWEEFLKGFERHCIKGRESEYLEWRLRDQEERHTKHGGTVYLQEPNVKTGCGGLRDYHSLLWIARVKRGFLGMADLQQAGLLTPSERKQIEAAHEFLLRVRNELHFQQKRGGDIMTLRLQGLIANHFRYQHRTILRRTEALMRTYYQHARVLFDVTNTLGRRLAGEADSPKRKTWAFLPLRAVRPEPVDEFLLTNGVLEIGEVSRLSQDPLLLVRAYLIAQQHGAEIGPDLELAVRRRLPLVTRAFIYQTGVREMLLAIFSKKGEVGRIVRAMHKVGLLGKLFPEFAPLDCLVQHEFFHQYTADEHTLQCIDMLDRTLGAEAKPFKPYEPLMKAVERPHLLYLAMLLHDTGKSANSRHHSDASAQNAVRVARRFKLPAADLGTLVFLVDHHLTMMETARRRNLDEEETITVFARIAQSMERLDLLMLLTFADSLGTNTQSAWSDWKELLLWQLYRRSREMLTGEREFVQAAQETIDATRERVRILLRHAELTMEELEAHFQNLPARYFQALADDEIVRHLRLVHEFLWKQFTQEDSSLLPVCEWFDHEEQGHSEFTLVSWDRERLFERVTGSFAAAGLNILSADIYTRADHIVVDTFRVATPRLEAVTDARDKDKVMKSIKLAFQPDAPEKPDESRRLSRASMAPYDDASFPTRVTFDLKTSRDHTVLDVQTPDRPGLLHRIAAIIADAGLRVVFARITTEKGAALDTFYLTDDHGKKVEDGVWLDALSRRLSKALG